MIEADAMVADVASSPQNERCVICKERFDDEKPTVVTEKGINTLIRFSEKRGFPELSAHLNECVQKTPIQVFVHKECRRDFTNPRRHSSFNNPATEEELPPAKKLRSSMPPFDWKVNCMLCGSVAKNDPRHPERDKVCHVTTLPMRSKLLECCDKRNDTWASEVKNRLCGCIDLVAAEAVYHSNCYSRFVLPYTTSRIVGRPQDKKMSNCFDMLCQWLESNPDTYTLTELHAKMIELSDDSAVYSVKWLKQKFHEHYEGSIFFAEVDGCSNVLCFKNIMAEFIVNDKWYAERKKDTKEELERIVTAAAKIIREEIRESEFDLKSYPTNEDIADVSKGKEWIPRHLQTFLKTIVQTEIKQNSIGHAILQAARPRSVITPTLFGIGVEMDHVFGSRWLVDQLSRFGFSISYDEVNRYKQSVIESENLSNLLTEYLPGTFTQWVADNVDHNVATLDGSGSLHGMGIIAISTPKDNAPLTANPRAVRRLQQRMKVNDLLKDKAVPLLQYVCSGERGLASIFYKPFVELQIPQTLPAELYSDVLWHSAWTCSYNTCTRPRPSWSGFMQQAFSDGSIPKSEVLLLPILDLNPSDESCIYSTLIYIQRQAEHLNVTTPCITFDQPLWLKAVEIITSKSLNIVCRLGGFHTMMSFMGSIGSMMKGSGLEEALETVYGPNAVAHMMSGKAVSRALRGHFLVEAALVNKLLLAVLPVPLERDDSETHNQNFVEIDSSSSEQKLIDADEVQKIDELYKGIVDKSVAVCDIAESKELVKLKECLLAHKAFLAEKSRTAKLWLQYIEYVETLKLFIRSERTGNWNLHLLAVEKMLNLFAATGHIHYAKMLDYICS